MEGQVVEMGLTTTSLLSAERFPVIVPNSLFSSQVSFSQKPYYICASFAIRYVEYHPQATSRIYYEILILSHC